MKIYKISDMIGGWFIGSFAPTAYTADFEVGYKVHKKGDEWDAHYHKEADEINYLIRGEMTINDTLLVSGDIFVIEKNEISSPVFLEDCELIVIKTKSVKGDKYLV